MQSDNLPFSDALTAEQIEQVFAAEGVSFGDAGCDANEALSDQRGTIDTMGVTLWAMLSQASLTDVQRACRSAVQRVAEYFAGCDGRRLAGVLATGEVKSYSTSGSAMPS